MENRRGFLKGMASTSLMSAAAYRNVLGANERVRVGFIGVGLIGKRHLLDFLAQPDVEVAAISEVYEPRLAEGVATAGGKAAAYRDFRRMLERQDIDAVVVSTPDHWHALMTILACAAGKDVYVEKPLTHVVREGRWMVRAARHYRRVVQVGTQQRSGEHYQKCVGLIRDGHLGEVRNARIAAFRNISPGFTTPVGTQPLSEQDWQMWLGPAPYVPFDPHRCIYHFRWFWDYSGGQTTNLLSHDLDIVHWAMGAMPRSVAAVGGRYSLKGIGETPDFFEAVFDYPGFIVNWSSREACAGARGGLEFCGTKGVLRLSRAGFEVTPDRLVSAESQIPQFPTTRSTQAAPADAPPPQYRTAPLKGEGFEQVRDQFRPHVRNFLDCVKSRKPTHCPVETGHRSTTATLLGKLALERRRVLTWDAKAERVTDDEAANKLLTYEYRSPWKLG